MLGSHVAFQCFIFLLISLVAACNNLLGIEDVSEFPCDVAPDIRSVMSGPTTSLLTQCSNGTGSCLQLLLNADPSPDVLSMELYDGFGGHDLLNGPGTYSLTPADSRPGSCGICLAIGANLDSNTSEYSKFYFPSPQGTLVLTTMDGNGAAGRLTALKFRHANLTNGTITYINDGCSTTIGDVEFTASYTGKACTPACSSDSVCAFDDDLQACCPAGFPNWCRSLQVCFNNLPQRNAACANAYYGDPSAGCKSGQVPMSLTGTTGSFCAPACSGTGSACPKAYAGTATSACSVSDTGSSTPSHCALSCTDIDVKGGQCPTAMTCRKASSGNGFCLY